MNIIDNKYWIRF